MFFKEYDPLSPEAVLQSLDAHRAPDGGGESMAGLAFALRLEGEYAPAQLDYEFLDAHTLRCTENGETFEAPYGAVRLGEVWLFSHLVPGTDRGWHCVLDKRSGAVTAFETWFGIEVATGTDPMFIQPPTGSRTVAREVQRQYSFGWADFGENGRPERLHTTTNRLEGRGLHWRYSDGYEILSFFPSVICSTVVELGERAGGITVAHPTDYLRIDDETFILCRGEVEFSGRLWIELVDFLDCRAVGLTLGFGEDDAFVYAFHAAALSITGDCAHLEAINDYGENLLLSRSAVGVRGGRYAYRPKDFRKPADHAEALQIARNRSVILEENSATNRMASKNGLAPTDFLAGKRFAVRPDGAPQTVSPWAGERATVYEYEVLSGSLLRWRENGGDWQKEKYVCFEPARGLYLFSHMCTGDPDFANLSHAVDFTNGLATTVRAQIGCWHSGWEVGSQVAFGTLEYGDLVPPFARRHHFTDDLVGRCYAWSYSKVLQSIHMYSAPESYSWTILREDGSGGPTWSSPCYYIKLRPDAYLFQWVEENCNGKQGLVVINPRILHDGGFFFGVGTDGLSLNTTGAYGRELGRCDILKYFGR